MAGKTGGSGESAVAGELLAGRYRLIEQRGRGGMGVVWCARDEVIGRLVAVKVLRVLSDATVREAEELRLRMRREARAAGRIHHPDVITVHDVIEANGRPAVVMELIDGPSLDDVLADRGRLDPREAAGIGARVCDALDAAHRAGVHHRDVKPGNILIARDGRVVLTDFGIADITSPDPAGADAGLTRTGQVLGSLHHMAPERAQGAPSGPPADLWSLGMTLYIAVEGVIPFQRGTAFATMTATVDDPLPSPRQAGPLAPVLTALLRKDPAQRPDAARARDLLAAIAATPHATVPAPDQQPATVPAPDQQPATAPTPDQPAAPPRVEVPRQAPPAAAPPAGGPGTGLTRPADCAPILRGAGPDEEAVRRLPLGAGPGSSARPAYKPGSLNPKSPATPAGRRRARTLVVLAAAVALAGAGVALAPIAADMLHGSGTPGRAAGPAAKAAAGPILSTMVRSLSAAAAGYVRVVEKPFTVEVPDGWRRQGPHSATKFVFAWGAYRLVVVAGRDSATAHGDDPMNYEVVEEPELAAFRNASWGQGSGLKQVRIGGRAGAQGTFIWKDGKGPDVYAENTVLAVGTRFHTVLVMGPDTKTGRNMVSRVAENASRTYTPTA